MTVRQFLKQHLTRHGFTDVQVIPASFFVQAKNKNGHRVMMMIGPDSVMMLAGTGMQMQKSGSGGKEPNGSDTSTNQ